jgi:fatty-acid desaturase
MRPDFTTTNFEPLVKGRRDWPAILSLGFNTDRNGKRRKPAWANIVTLGILLPGFAMWGLYRAFATPTGVGLWALAAALYLFTMFGVTVGNHRFWTHRGFKARFPLQVVLAVASGMSIEGDIQGWVMNHRTHHRFADMVGRDPHSPYEYPGWRGYKGLVWAQGVWLFFARERPPGYVLHRDLAEDRLVQWQRRAFPFLVEFGADSRGAARSSPHDSHRFRQLGVPQMGQPGKGQPWARVRC